MLHQENARETQTPITYSLIMALLRLVLLLFLCSCTAILGDVISEYCNENRTITSLQMSANIDNLLASVAASTAQNGYSIATYGTGKDKVYGLGQCRRDVNSTECSTCIHAAANGIRSGCGVNSTDERNWYDECFLRYYDEKFFGKIDPSVFIYFYNIDKPKNLDLFKKQLGILMNNLTSQAIVPSNKGLGKGNIKISSSVTLYGLVQCTEDLSPHSCFRCLKIAIGNFPKFCNEENTVGCRVQYSSCVLRYEIYQF